MNKHLSPLPDFARRLLQSIADRPIWAAVDETMTIAQMKRGSRR